MSIYTKKGDKGKTGLLGDRRLSKTDQVFELLGSLDQANAATGLARSLMKNAEIGERFLQLQDFYFQIGAATASPSPQEAKVVSRLDKLTAELEATIDHWDNQMPELRNFVFPGGEPAAAALHLARTFVRQAERHYHRLPETIRVEAISRYLNRLSDFYFQAARYYNFTSGQKDTVWKDK